MFSGRYFGIALLAAVLTGTLVLTVAAGYILSTVAGINAERPAVEPAPIPHLSDNLRGELDAAFTPEFPFNFDAAANPFADKSGISSAVGAAESTSGSLPAAPTVNGIYPPRSTVVSSLPYPGIPLPPTGTTVPVGATTALNGGLAEAGDTTDLIRERQRSVKLGKSVAPLASFYGIDELRPYGVVGTGNANRVKLFAPSTNDRFSVARGTRFRDGTIVSFSDESVTYRRDGGEVVVKRWTKNLQTPAAGGSPPDAPVIRLDQP